MEDAARLTRAQLEQLYESLGPSLLLYLERRTGDPALAADLVQDVFVRLMEAPIRSGSPAESRSYLYRVAHSRLVDHGRRERRERLWQALQGRKPALSPAPELSDLERAFRALKPRESTLLWLAYQEGMDHNEIAKVLDVKAASVRVLLHRARRRLRSSLLGLGLQPEGSR